MNAGIKSTGIAVLFALFALAAVGLVLNSSLSPRSATYGHQHVHPTVSAELEVLRRNVGRLQTQSDQQQAELEVLRGNVGRLQTQPDQQQQQAELEVLRRNVGRLQTQPDQQQQVHWLPAGADKAARRASQQEALMALGIRDQLRGRHLQANLTGARWCEALLAACATEPDRCRGMAEPPLLRHRNRALHAFLGQYHQDWALFSSVFAAEAAAGRRGVYLDLAAAWPTFLSNTFFFDACLGWEGVCIEADPSKTPALLAHRGCVLVDTCTDREEGTTLFINPQSHDGTSSVRRRYIERSNHTASLNCTTLARILHETNTPHVDFLSLDAEGAEMDALRGLDMASVRIEMIVLEVEHFTSPTVNLTARGAEFAAWFEKHDYLPALVFPVDQMPPPPLTSQRVLTQVPRGQTRSKTKDVLWVRRDSRYRPSVEAWAEEQRAERAERMG